MAKMKFVQKVGSGRNVRVGASSPKPRISHTQQNTNGIQAEEGESARVKVLEHLGGGKLIVELKGQRVVANTNLWLEKDQEIDVIVKNVGTKIILQLMANTQHSISVAQTTGMRMPLGDIMSQLMASLENAEATASPTLDGTLRELLQNMKELIQQMPVDVTAEDLPKQIQFALKTLGCNYESKLARALASEYFPKEEVVIQLKSQLVQLRSALGDMPLQAALLANINYMLENIEVAQNTAMKTPLGDVIHQLMTSLENAEAAILPTLDGELRELMQNVKGLIQRMSVDVTAEDLPKQIQSAVGTLGRDYESNLARVLASNHFSTKEAVLQLKAQLMQLQSALSDKPLQAALLENVNYMLENIEFQQLSSIPHDDDSLRFYFQLPVILHDQMTTAEIEFFRPKAGNDEDDNRFGLVLNFDLERLGHIEFIINIIHRYVNCQIKTDEYETYTLAMEYAEDLEKKLTAIGYDVGAIHCALDDSEAYSGSNSLDQQMAIDNIDITI